MKKLLVVLGLLVLVSGLALAQAAPAPSYFVDYFSNNHTSPADQIVRVINAGEFGSPIIAPTGDICVNFYVHNADQEMIACCAAKLTPNELSSAYVGPDLTSNPLNSTIIPASGVIKVTLTRDDSGASCDPRTPSGIPDATLGEVFATHLQVTNGNTYVTETEKLSSPLGEAEAGYLPGTCFFVQLLGSGTGVCKTHTPGD